MLSPDVAVAIITESALSFLGLGFPSDFPTWGRLLYDGKDFIRITPMRVVGPGTLISLTVIASTTSAMACMTPSIRRSVAGNRITHLPVSGRLRVGPRSLPCWRHVDSDRLWPRSTEMVDMR